MGIQPITVPVDIKKANLDGLGIRRAIFGKPAVIPFRPIVVARRLFGLQPSMGIRTAGDLRAAVTWKNVGTDDHAFDILVLYGIYDAGTAEFDLYWEGIIQNVTSSPGDQKTTNVDTTVPNVSPGKYDALVSICDAVLTPATGGGLSIATLPSEMTCEELKASEYKDTILSYDINGNNLIDKEESVQAINDYYVGKITSEQANAVVRACSLGCDLTGWTGGGGDVWLPDVVYAQMLYEDVIEIVGPAVAAEIIGTVFSTI